MGNIYSFEIQRDDLNRKLGGGFPKGSFVLIEGGSGAGKSTISQRLTYGLLQNKGTVTYISTQQTTKGFIHQMYSIDYPIASSLLNGTFLYIPVIPLVRAAKSRIDFIERLMSAQELFENDIIIVDTISSLIKYSVNTEKSLELISFFKKLNGMGKIIILTIEPSQLNEEIASMFRSSCDIYCSLKVKPMSNEVKRTIVVNKFTGAKGPVGQMIGFRIEPRVGLVVEIAAVG
ncbi:ATPase domain-containing protein [Methanosalsum natronophilum]|uniref:ATPase domain-containing protein n=1 Tax=Methanosalsum natronophilum TaxID=768733 RepID=UPI002168EB1A|nr:ATPase domain-containing protein [Methanosalsum natronophilum]MCS3923702.1 flagellar protein FlaH [Methanosalsum natronophilum]